MATYDEQVQERLRQMQKANKPAAQNRSAKFQQANQRLAQEAQQERIRQVGADPQQEKLRRTVAERENAQQERLRQARDNVRSQAQAKPEPQAKPQPQAKAKPQPKATSPEAPRVERAKEAVQKGTQKAKEVGKAGWDATKRLAGRIPGGSVAKGAANIVRGGWGLLWNPATVTYAGLEAANQFGLANPGEQMRRTDANQAAALQQAFGRIAPTPTQIGNRDDSFLGGVSRAAADLGGSVIPETLQGIKRGFNFVAGADLLDTDPGTDVGDENLAAMEAAQKELFDMSMQATGNVGKASATVNAFNQLTSALADPATIQAFQNSAPNSPQREALYAGFVQQLVNSGADVATLADMAGPGGMDLDPQFVNLLLNTAQTAQDEADTLTEVRPNGERKPEVPGAPAATEPAVTVDELKFRPEGRAAQDVNLFALKDRPLSLTDSQVPGSTPAYGFDAAGNPVRRPGYEPGIPAAERDQFLRGVPNLVGSPAQSLEAGRAYANEISGNIAALDQLQEDGQIRLLGRPRQRALDFAGRLRDPRELAKIDMEVAAQKTGGLPGMSAAQLMQMDYPERLAAITEMRNQGVALAAQKMNTPGARRRIDQLADPDGSMREAAQRGFRGARLALQNARADAREQLEGQYLSQYAPDYSDLAGRETEDYRADQYATQLQMGRQRQQDLRQMITDIAPTEEAARTAINDARLSGIFDMVQNENISIADQAYMGAGLAIANYIRKTYQDKTGRMGGSNLRDIARSGDRNAVDALFNNKDWYLRGPKGTDIIRSEVRGSLIDQLIAAGTGGLFGNEGPETLILEGPGGKEIKVSDLLEDPTVQAFLGGYLDDAMNTQ